jgi:hypothetical protein
MVYRYFSHVHPIRSESVASKGKKGRQAGSERRADKQVQTTSFSSSVLARLLPSTMPIASRLAPNAVEPAVCSL